MSTIHAKSSSAITVASRRSPHATNRLLCRIYDLCHPALRALRGNRHVIRLLFGARIPAGMQVQFDPTTVLLSRVLSAIATPEDRACLEVGIGEGALISLSIARRHPMQLVGVDCSEARVLQSRRVAEANGFAVDFFKSDLLSAVPPALRFDLIFFNPPYVPTETGRRLRLTERLTVDGDQMWDGGLDGTAVLSRFLEQAKEYLSARGRIVFGVQSLFVPDKLVVEIIHRSGLKLQQRQTRRFLPSIAYIIEKGD
jgi:release factor glutamine methyltransferase